MTSTEPGGKDTPAPAAPEPADSAAMQDETDVALAHKTDVKSQASAKADALKQRAQTARSEAKQRAGKVGERVRTGPRPAIAAVVVLVVLLLVRRRRHRGD
jgi:uncharacterized protein (DUF1501 family)